MRHGRFGPVGNELDGVDEVLFIGPQPIEAVRLGQVLDRQVLGQGFALGFELSHLGAPGLEAQADPRRLEQVVANLVENALVHGATPVLVEARPYVGEVEVTVRDHGPGVPESLVPTLFSRLRTFGRGDRDRGRGTGLGLALVRGLVEAMGGRVRYEPAADGGASFCLVLPSPPRRGRSLPQSR